MSSKRLTILIVILSLNLAQARGHFMNPDLCMRNLVIFLQNFARVCMNSDHSEKECERRELIIFKEGVKECYPHIKEA